MRHARAIYPLFGSSFNLPVSEESYQESVASCRFFLPLEICSTKTTLPINFTTHYSLVRCQWYRAHLDRAMSVSSLRCIHLRQWLPLCESSSEVSPFEQKWGAVQPLLQLKATFWSENQFIPRWACLLQYSCDYIRRHRVYQVFKNPHQYSPVRDYRSHGSKTLLYPS